MRSCARYSHIANIYSSFPFPIQVPFPFLYLLDFDYIKSALRCNIIIEQPHKKKKKKIAKCRKSYF